MPRVSPERRVEHERYLARRIREERERRDWTLERLAQRMTDAGCPMDRSAIYRIESGRPPRRITIDEAITFAGVFDLKLNGMLMPAAVAKKAEAVKLWRRHAALVRAEVYAKEERKTVERDLLSMVDEDFQPEVLEAFELAGGDATPQIFFHRRKTDRASGSTSVPTLSDSRGNVPDASLHSVHAPSTLDRSSASSG